MRRGSNRSRPSRLDGDVTFGIFDRRIEPTGGNPPDERDKHQSLLAYGTHFRERVAPGLALLLDEFPLGNQPPQVFLDGLNGSKTKVLLDLAHGGRETIEESLTNVSVYFFTGFPGGRFGCHSIHKIADICLVCQGNIFGPACVQKRREAPKPPGVVLILTTNYYVRPIIRSGLR